MKVLFLNEGDRKKHYSRIERDFFLKLGDLCHLSVYDLDCSYYDKRIGAGELERLFRPDLVLVLYTYYMRVGKGRFLYNHFIDKFRVPVVVVEVEHHKFPDRDNWYRKHGVDLVLFRGAVEKCSVPSAWLPFSANEQEFSLGDNSRSDKILFVGSDGVGNSDYKLRRDALRLLDKNKLLYKADGLQGRDYAEILKQFKCGFACGLGELHTLIAKVFEMMACGCVVLDQKIKYDEILFGNKKCYFTYRDDLSDLVDIVRFVLNNDVSEIRNNAYEIVSKFHTDRVRIMELYEILTSFLYKGEIYKPWGM